jgi:hypothetical protein
MMVVVLLWAGTGVARADDIQTFDVSGSLTAWENASCSASGCTLDGTLVIDTTTGAVISAAVTFSGESPVTGPFTNFVEITEIPILGETRVELQGVASVDELDLFFVTPTAGSLVGYEGGALDIDDTYASHVGFDSSNETFYVSYWDLTSGALTSEDASTPEPSSLLLLGSGLLGLAALVLYRSASGKA